MSAAVQLGRVWGEASADTAWSGVTRAEQPTKRDRSSARADTTSRETEPATSVAFYRKHTESILRRYLYSSMQVGRAPSLLGDSVGRGWVSSRPVRTFEDAIIFVLDVERCLSRLNTLDRQLLSRIVLQEYTYTEAASLIGMGVRTIAKKFPLAVDRLTELLLQAGLLVLPR